MACPCRRNLKRKRTSNEATTSSEGGDHVDVDDRMKRKSKKPEAAEEEAQPAVCAGKKKTDEKRKRVVTERLPLPHISFLRAALGAVWPAAPTKMFSINALILGAVNIELSLKKYFQNRNFRL